MSSSWFMFYLLPEVSIMTRLLFSRAALAALGHLAIPPSVLTCLMLKTACICRPQLSGTPPKLWWFLWTHLAEPFSPPLLFLVRRIIGAYCPKPSGSLSYNVCFFICDRYGRPHIAEKVLLPCFGRLFFGQVLGRFLQTVTDLKLYLSLFRWI